MTREQELELQRNAAIKVVEELRQQLAAARQQVWEEAAKYLEENQRVTPRIGPLWSAGWTEAASSFATWCREQAKKGQP